MSWWNRFLNSRFCFPTESPPSEEESETSETPEANIIEDINAEGGIEMNDQTNADSEDSMDLPEDDMANATEDMDVEEINQGILIQHSFSTQTLNDFFEDKTNFMTVQD